MISVFYYSIVKAVVAHEAALRAKAKKMNVESLRSAGKDDDESAEFKIAKVAITNVLLWIFIWTPYAAVSALPALGYQHLLTPMVSQLPSLIGLYEIFLKPILRIILLSQDCLLHQSCGVCCLTPKVPRSDGYRIALSWYWRETQTF